MDELIKKLQEKAKACGDKTKEDRARKGAYIDCIVELDPSKAVFLEVQNDFGVNIVDPKLFLVKYIATSEPILRFYFEGELDGEPEIKGLKTIKELRWFNLEDSKKLDLAFKKTDLEALNQFSMIV